MTQYGLLSPSQPQGLLNYDEKQSRLDAFINSIGAMSPHLLAAGAASTDPGNFGRSMAQAGQAFSQTHQNSLANSRSAALQDFSTRAQLAEYQRKRKQDMARERYSTAMQMGGKDMAGQPVDVRGLLADAYPDRVAEAQIPGLLGPQKPIEVSPGATLYDPKTRSAMYTAPGQNKPTSLQQNLQDAGLKPGTPRYQEAILASLNKPGVSVNLGNNDKTNPKVLARYEDAYSRNASRQDRLRGLESMASLAGRVQSGFGADTRLEATKALSALGFDVDMSGVASAEQFRTLAMDRVMEHIAKTKGAISEKEMAAFERASPSLANTPEGNRLILKAAIEAERRAAVVDEFTQQTVQENPEIGLFALDRLVSNYRRELSKQPVFSPEEMEAFSNPNAAGSSAPYQQGKQQPPRVVRNPQTGKLEMQTAPPQGLDNPMSGRGDEHLRGR